MDSQKTNTQDPISNFAPVVSVLGHVDHGKTSLLDKIRESSVAAREKGGITQKIGASEIEITHEGKKRRVTFIDTPGHEAFANMRSQGVNAADIALLIVAADDGIMPQTRESIGKILEAKIPFIVVFTKIDLPGAQIEKAKQQVIKEGILLEGLGGDTPFIGVSSKTGENVKELLDLIVLVYDLSGIKKSDLDPFMGVVIDAKQDKRRGVVSTLVVKSGEIKIASKLYTHGKEVGKIRAIVNTIGKNVPSAKVGEAVEILGFSEALPAGSVIYDREVEPIVAPVIAPVVQTPQDMMAFLREDTSNIIPIVLKTETTAEMEAIKEALPEEIKVILEGQGEISVADILLAHDFKALVLGFNVDATREAKQLADSEKVFFKSYEIIYQMLDEIGMLLTAVKTGEEERSIGKGQILASFLGTTGTIIGLKVTEGRLAVGDRIKVFRGEKELGAAEITSIRHGKNDVKIVEKNTECGLMLSRDIDFAPQDVIIAYSKKS
ncbi:MAG TPA: translation initiation factor IF-2 [Patescibacteria group bacterium]|nr:translation initiation factor IF-2 [Patescibacteria group bacterium]